MWGSPAQACYTPASTAPHQSPSRGEWPEAVHARTHARVCSGIPDSTHSFIQGDDMATWGSMYSMMNCCTIHPLSTRQSTAMSSTCWIPPTGLILAMQAGVGM